MNVCIIGWYGTETLGDRAILTGILCFLAEAFSDLTVSVGSLHPFHSERTVAEDEGLWRSLVAREISLGLFDSTVPSSLKKAIRGSDLLLMGGGPLMDLREMHMVSFAFQYARRRGIRTAVFGCGVGPLNKPVFRRAVADLLDHTDVAVFRDRFSEAESRRLCPNSTFRSYSAIDPAAYCAVKYRDQATPIELQDQIVINLRSLPGKFGAPGVDSSFEKAAQTMLERILAVNETSQVVLMPNHYFFFGGDDRVLMNALKFRIENTRLRVQNQPLSLRATMDTIVSSACCIGMRFHSVVLMSLLNGRCRILNYTGRNRGKIFGFLEDFDPDGFFGAGRMQVLVPGCSELSVVDGLQDEASFEPPEDRLSKAFQTYRSVLSGLM